MTTTMVLLVRHGQTRSNVTGFYMGWSEEDLDDSGNSQVHRLSARLAGLPITSIYSSPLKRTHTSAMILSEPHHLPVQLSEDLAELRLGEWQGLHMDEVKARWPDLWQQSRIDPSEVTLPGGESFQQVSERAVRAFDRIVSTNQGKHALLVTHEIVVKVLAAHALGAPLSIYRRFEVSNASLTVVRVFDGKLRLIALNDTSHLVPCP